MAKKPSTRPTPQEAQRRKSGLGPGMVKTSVALLAEQRERIMAAAAAEQRDWTKHLVVLAMRQLDVEATVSRSN